MKELWSNNNNPSIAEYAVILAIILVIVVGVIKLSGSNADNAFSENVSAIVQ